MQGCGLGLNVSTLHTTTYEGHLSYVYAIVQWQLQLNLPSMCCQTTEITNTNHLDLRQHQNINITRFPCYTNFCKILNEFPHTYN